MAEQVYRLASLEGGLIEVTMEWDDVEDVALRLRVVNGSGVVVFVEIKNTLTGAEHGAHFGPNMEKTKAINPEFTVTQHPTIAGRLLGFTYTITWPFN